MDKVIEWFAPYANIDRLTIDEAQELSRLARNETNDFVKKQLYDRLILGTMYVIYNYILNNKLYSIVNQSYDIEDLTSSFTRQWITLIKNGDLERYSSFSLAMNVVKLPSKAIKGITNDKASEESRLSKGSAGRFLFTKDNIDKCIEVYSKVMRQKGICEVSDIVKEVDISTADAALIIETFDELSEEGWIKRFFGKEASAPADYEVIDTSLREKKVSIFDEELVETTLSDGKDMDTFLYQDIAHDLVEQLDDRLKFVITKRYGLDGERCLSTREIADALGISTQRAIQLEHKAFWILRSKMSRNIYSRRPRISMYAWVRDGNPISYRTFWRLGKYLNEEELEVARMLYCDGITKTKHGICERLNISSERYDEILRKIDYALKNTSYYSILDDSFENMVENYNLVDTPIKR